MGANIRLRVWADWARHKVMVAPKCCKCGRYGSVDPVELMQWATLHRWPSSAAVNAKKFKCLKCGGRASELKSSLMPASVPNWGPSEREWKRMQNRLRS